MAVEQDLDFAAITDHAEASRWRPAGADDGDVSIWQIQADRVAAADHLGLEVVWRLGYPLSNRLRRSILEWPAFVPEKT